MVVTATLVMSILQNEDKKHLISNVLSLGNKMFSKGSKELKLLAIS